MHCSKRDPFFPLCVNEKVSLKMLLIAFQATWIPYDFNKNVMIK